MRSFFIVFLLVTGSALTALLTSPAAMAAAGDMDHIVAVVDDDVVLRSELDKELNVTISRLRASGAPLPARDVVERQVLEELIQSRLQEAAAARAGVTVTDEEVDNAIAGIARRNGISVAQMREILGRSGVNYAGFRANIRKQLLAVSFQRQQIGRDIQVSEAEIDNHLALSGGNEGSRYRLLHILVATPAQASPEDTAQAREAAEALLSQIRDGADFKVLAREHSTGDKAAEGGDLGWKKKSELPPLFAAQVGRMGKGDTAGPLRDARGFHIIRLQDFQGTGKRNLVTETHARHILIRTGERTSDQDARQKLLQLRNRILNGEAFGTLARASSDDTASALKGGDLGWISPGDVVPEFQKQLENQDLNQISEPFKTPFGWHIVQVLERRQNDNSDRGKREEAANEIRQRKAEEALQVLTRRLRDEAYVEIRLGQEDF
ncbi:MAG: peptidylprolyl isomerase [Pseudomonadota bacterium]